MNEELLELLDDDAIVFDEFESCIAGVIARFGQENIICYDYRKVIDQLMADMSEEDAVEHFYFNIIGSGLGSRTPCFLFTSESTGLTTQPSES